jgi:hypothetical protein
MSEYFRAKESLTAQGKLTAFFTPSMLSGVPSEASALLGNFENSMNTDIIHPFNTVTHSKTFHALAHQSSFHYND